MFTRHLCFSRSIQSTRCQLCVLSYFVNIRHLQCFHTLFTTPVMPLQPSISLCPLRPSIESVASEQQVILGCNGKRVAHEGSSVDEKGSRHRSWDPTDTIVLSGDARWMLEVGRSFLHIRTFVSVHHSRNWDSEVRCWAYEICIHVRKASLQIVLRLKFCCMSQNRQSRVNSKGFFA